MEEDVIDSLVMGDLHSPTDASVIAEQAMGWLECTCLKRLRAKLDGRYRANYLAIIVETHGRRSAQSRTCLQRLGLGTYVTWGLNDAMQGKKA